MLVFQSIAPWYIPGRILGNSLLLILGSVAVGFVAFFGFKNRWPGAKNILRENNPSVLFIITSGLLIIVFLGFEVTAATLFQNKIVSRSLSPTYIPLTIILFIFISALVVPYQKRFSNKIVNSILIIGILIWLVYPIRANVYNAMNWISNGQMHSSQAWRESQTIQYLVQHPNIKSECPIYTNDRYSIFILAHLSTTSALNQIEYGSPETGIAKLKGFWPEQDEVCLVWFNHSTESDFFYYSFDEIQAVANLSLISQFDDGAIYLVSRK